jgi:prolyl-tRNA editing enzyme YbaK/EbsC (Cys-tRNA(Pro) deacylase)
VESVAPSNVWPEPVERVARFLREAGAEASVEEFSTPTPTAEAAALAIGCELRQIVKSLLFECDDGRPVVALVPGDRRADAAKVAAAVVAKRARIADPERVREITGFEPGAVAPFPLTRVERVLLEPGLLAHARVWVGAGSDRHMAGLAPVELVRLARAEPRDLVRDD